MSSLTIPLSAESGPLGAWAYVIGGGVLLILVILLLALMAVGGGREHS